MMPIDAPATKGPEDAALVACALRCLGAADAVTKEVSETFILDGGGLDLGAIGTAAGIVLPMQGVARATSLLDTGARRVLVGEAALLDSSIVGALATKFGGQRVGVYVPARRRAVSWSFDTVSNADFKVLTPSHGAPAWEALRADGARTGTDVLWWVGEMLKRGASEVLLQVDIRDDADLNLCAECVERFEHRLWIAPLHDTRPPLDDWVRFGHARQLALPSALYAWISYVREVAVSADLADGSTNVVT